LTSVKSGIRDIQAIFLVNVRFSKTDKMTAIRYLRE